MLGNYGRLGNQMFQYASLRGIAAKNSYDFMIPGSQHSLSCFKLDFEKIETLKIADYFDKIYVEPENDLSFNQSLFSLPQGVSLVGYFQNYQYFEHIESEIRKDFTFKDEIVEKSKTLLENKFPKNKKIVGVHVRRTDYLNLQHVYHICDADYYKSAMQKMLETFEDLEFLFFTDDKPWVRENFKNSNISNFENPCFDLCTLSLCDHHIICNSSFSWWGAWLAKSKKQAVICPTKWFSDTGPKISDGLLLKNWRKL